MNLYIYIKICLIIYFQLFHALKIMNKYELLYQYEKNKRLITNPFIVQWWVTEDSIKEEKKYIVN